MITVLITGGSGFIGSHACERRLPGNNRGRAIPNRARTTVSVGP